MNKQDRIYSELIHEGAGIWHISDEYGSKVMVKAPGTSIKALVNGCKFQLLFGRDEGSEPNIFHTGLKIYDDPVNYQMIFGTNRFLDEHLSIEKIWNLDKVQIQLFNELNVCIAFGDLAINEQYKHEILTLLGNPKRLYTGQFSSEISRSLDRFENCFRNVPAILSESFRVVEAVGQIANLQQMKNYFIHDEKTVVKTHVSGTEGEELEKEVFSVLYSLFNKNTIKNPRIPYKNDARELTDILAFSELGIFLFETKALSVMTAKTDRTMERKVAGLKKQINKAIDQLVGAMKKVADNTPISDDEGNQVQFNRKLVPHGIILISEFLQFGEWDEIITSILKAMIESHSMIHVMDMREFMQFIGHAQGDKDRFDHFLVERATHFAQKPTMFVTTKFMRSGEES
jgi:hypothetical protein